MPFVNDTLSETSIWPSSQINNNNKNHRLSKRFRPSIQCNHINKLTNEQCTANGFMECVHCDQICCLIHITEHQDELKQLRDKLVEEASETYITLSEMQVTDSRKQLQTDLALWKTKMLNKIERIHEKLLDDVEDSFIKIRSDFEITKYNLANDFGENISSKLESLSSKNDFYPHELDELRLSLDEMYIRLSEARTSMITIDFGNGNNCLLDYDDRFDFNNTIESPKIIVQTKPDIERILNGSYLRQFHIEIDNDSNHIPLLYDTSNKHLLVCNNESNTLELFNHEERISGGFWPKEYSLITCIKWCSYLNTFLVLCSQSLYALNCSQEPFNIYPITQVSPIDGHPMKYISVNKDIMLIKYGHGLFIDSYSLEKMELIKRWTKNDFYPDCENTIYIHRIELYSNFYLAMNVEINDENDVLDLFIFPNMQHIRRLENSYLMLYLPLNNYWIIKQKKDNNRTDLCLLDQHGHTDQLNIIDGDNIYIGLSLLITGSFAHRHAAQISNITDYSLISATGFVIALGVIIIILSIIGFIGILKSRIGFLKIFIGSLLIILLLQLISAIIAFTLRSKAENQLRRKLILSLSDYKNENADIVNEWDHLQKLWSCCGVDSAQDWIEYGKLSVPPKSCCSNDDCTLSANATTYFDRGCYGSARTLFFRYSKTLAGISIVFFFIEFIGFLLAIFLLRDLKKNYGAV